MGLFFNVRKPRKFDYRPVYYDERKEALQNRVERIKQELEQIPAGTGGVGLKGSFVKQSRFLRRNKAKMVERPGTVKILLVLFVLIGVLYILYHF